MKKTRMSTEYENMLCKDEKDISFEYANYLENYNTLLPLARFRIPKANNSPCKFMRRNSFNYLSHFATKIFEINGELN